MCECSGGRRRFRCVCLSQSTDSVLIRAKKTVFENKDTISERTFTGCSNSKAGMLLMALYLLVYFLFIIYWTLYIFREVCSKKVAKHQRKRVHFAFEAKIEKTFRSIKASPQLIQRTPSNTAFNWGKCRLSSLFLIMC